MAQIAKKTKRNHHGLLCAHEYDDVFAASINEPEATAILANGLERAGIGRRDQKVPSVGSEDRAVRAERRKGRDALSRVRPRLATGPSS
ncbi:MULTISPECIES: hypothetical protein [unclassified Mesorhizobium]|uniref:hypothetical protein n=1 Tax=unclassified Mesorhizobium TaxID=325217 RepID=UPI000F76508B|nr:MULTISPECIES: hypothetical protein [unclassified Mesorhizobium]RUU48998.1 hypothetical protein EOD08_00200 [Mesorhizobium sp. M6A.T.Ca.TU.002.02.2.1]AZO64315.1 hypothetical protein EJ075_04575 [Mesorhizobium sp. M6A.T.Cr.TU.016.01.1.1]RUU30747.1 hypothetical protein EOC94_07075 [Mesorhizobium sp. M6A.T.Ce.TU.016.01.1.1]RWN67668.1 MAG: hypothetical protein EOR99_10375 [Mesorhizobium sp.]RWP56434.1 MAG: hypothetical protein EOR06_02565 [Mesorhizobium sp.]